MTEIDQRMSLAVYTGSIAELRNCLMLVQCQAPYPAGSAPKWILRYGSRDSQLLGGVHRESFTIVGTATPVGDRGWNNFRDINKWDPDA